MNSQIPISQIQNLTSKVALRVDIQSDDEERERGEWIWLVFIGLN